MTDRRKTRDVLFSALQCAKFDRQSFIDAYNNDMSEPAVQNAIKDIKAFDRLQEMLFGTIRTEADRVIDGMKVVTLPELRKFLETNPELFNEDEST